MRPRKVTAVYFSGTGTTKTAVTRIARAMAEKLNTAYEEFSYTLPAARADILQFSADDLVVFGSPVYAGRVPNVLLPYLKEKVKVCLAPSCRHRDLHTGPARSRGGRDRSRGRRDCGPPG